MSAGGAPGAGAAHDARPDGIPGSALSGPFPVGQYAVVYDFGAGTFDASVVRRVIEVLRARDC